MKRVLNWFRQRRLEDDLDRELQYHVDRRVADLIQSGLPESEARKRVAMELAGTMDTRHVLAIDVPTMNYGKTPQQVVEFYKESMRRIDALPGVNKTAFGMAVPCSTKRAVEKNAGRTL